MFMSTSTRTSEELSRATPSTRLCFTALYTNDLEQHREGKGKPHMTRNNNETDRNRIQTSNFCPDTLASLEWVLGMQHICLETSNMKSARTGLISLKIGRTAHHSSKRSVARLVQATTGGIGRPTDVLADLHQGFCIDQDCFNMFFVQKNLENGWESSPVQKWSRLKRST